MKKTAPLLVLVLMAVTFAVHPDNAKAHQLLLKQANEAAAKHILNQCTFEETTSLYKKAIAKSSEDPAVMLEFVNKSLYMMKFLLRDEHMENAVTYYRKYAAKGGNNIETMREIGYAYIHYIANDEEGFRWLNKSIALAEKKLHDARQSGSNTESNRLINEILTAYNFMALGHNYDGNFEKSVELLASVSKKYPEGNTERPQHHFARSHLWLAKRSLGDGDFPGAGRHLAAAERVAAKARKIDGTGEDIQYYKKLLRECAAVNGKKAAYTQKLLILYVGKGRMRRIVPTTIPADQFDGFIKARLSSYDFDLLKKCYVLNSQRSVYELSKKGMGELGPEKKIEETVISRHLGSVLYKDSSRAEYYPEQVMTETDFRLTKIYVNLLARQIQAMTKGNLALQIRHEFLKDSAMTGHAPNYGYGFAADYKRIDPYPSELIFDAVNEYDGILLVTAENMSPSNGYGIIAYGGTNYIPIIPYILDSPFRGMVRISCDKIRNMHGIWFLHEYFHTVENLWEISPSHGWEYNRNASRYLMPGESDNHLELDYYRWQFGIKIPEKIKELSAMGDDSGWAHFSWTKRKPMRLSKEAFNNLLGKVKDVALEDRREAQDLMIRAKTAREKKEKGLADQLYRQALKLNPACFEAYRFIGDRAAEEKHYREAVEYSAEYLKYVDDPRHLSKTAAICIKNLDDDIQGNAFADRAIDTEEDMAKKVRWCREAANAYWAKKKYRDAARYYERGASLNFGKDSLECVFFKGEALVAAGDKEAGLSLMRSSYDKGLKGDKRFDVKMKRINK